MYIYLQNYPFPKKNPGYESGHYEYANFTKYIISISNKILLIYLIISVAGLHRNENFFID